MLEWWKVPSTFHAAKLHHCNAMHAARTSAHIQALEHKTSHADLLESGWLAGSPVQLVILQKLQTKLNWKPCKQLGNSTSIYCRG
jgi:hypothetical protein